MDCKDIEILLEKYFEGQTSMEEELTVKNYLNTTTDLPKNLEYAKHIFGYFKEASHEDIKTKVNPQINRRILGLSRKQVSFISGIAASVAIFIGCYFAFNNPNEEVVYAYINGKPVTNEKIAIEETKRALLTISSNLNRGTTHLNYLTKINEVEQLLIKKE